jgi:hypothetical protein
VSGGALKPTVDELERVDGGWVHLSCALMIPLPGSLMHVFLPDQHTRDYVGGLHLV